MSGVGKALTRKFGPLPAWAWAGIGGVALYVIRRKQTGSPVVPQAVQNALPTGVSTDSSSTGTADDLQPLSPDPTSYSDNTATYTDQTDYGSGGSSGGGGASDGTGSGGTNEFPPPAPPVPTPPSKAPLATILSKGTTLTPANANVKNILTTKIPTTTAGKTPPRARKANVMPKPVAKTAARAASSGAAAVAKKVSAPAARTKTTTAPKTATAPRTAPTRTTPPPAPAPKPVAKPQPPKPAVKLPTVSPLVGKDAAPLKTVLAPVAKTTTSKPPLKKRT